LLQVGECWLIYRIQANTRVRAQVVVPELERLRKFINPTQSDTTKTKTQAQAQAQT
jgi:hypothetical protein